MRNRKIITVVFLLVGLFGMARARADEPEEPQPGVARVSLIHGDVSTQRGDSGDWVAATVNAPVVAGDRVTTGVRSRAEVQLDYANVLRLSGSTEAKIAELTRTRQQVQLTRGLLNFSVFKGSEADVEIDTVNVAVRPVGQGSYRVLVPTDDETQVIVRQGEADVTTPQGSTTVKKGQMITIRGRDNPEYQVAEAPHSDDWDNWNKDRDHQIQDARSWGHTNRYYTGASDLDGYGRWTYVPGYGMVWSPYGGAGWAPYRSGRWIWEPYWGWTWVSYEPWGWAPYHYGRWFLYAGSWCWWPGPVFGGYRPIWAPAYVSFFGFGRHRGFGVGFGFGSIGWLPIGPSDGFFPWWGRHRNNVNIVNITNITNINIRNGQGIGPLGHGRPVYSNLGGVLNNGHIQRGITGMPVDDFGRRAVPRDHHQVPVAELRDAKMVAGAVPVVPTRDSLRPVDRAANPATIRDHGDRPERFFARNQPTHRTESFRNDAAQMQEVIDRHQPNAPGNRLGNDKDNPRNASEPNRPTRITDESRPARGDDARQGRGVDQQNPGRGSDAARPTVNGRDAPRAGEPGSKPARDADAPRGADRERQPATSADSDRRSSPGFRRFGDRNDSGARNQAEQPAQPRSREEGRQPAGATNQQRPAADDRQTPRGRGDGNREQPARSTPQGQSDSGWQKFPGPGRATGNDGPARPSRTESSERPRGSDGGSAPKADREPRRPETTTPERRPNTPPPSEEHSGWQRFEPRPERNGASRNTDSPRSMDSGRTMDSSGGDRSDRSFGRDRGPSVDRGGMESRSPREASPRAERPPLQMQRPVVTPRAPAREASPQPRRESPPPRGNSGGNNSSRQSRPSGPSRPR